MPIPCGSTCALDKLYSKAAQPVARGPHLAREAILCGPRGLFARLISSWKGLPFSGKQKGLTLVLAINAAKKKPEFLGKNSW